MAAPRIFLLSPAHLGGVRGRLLLGDRAGFELATKLRTEGVPLGDVYRFVSQLYFRGKLIYAQTFAVPPVGLHGCYVITPGRGLVVPETIVTQRDLCEMAAVDIDHRNDPYRAPLLRDARAMVDTKSDVVLLGSIATDKYLKPLLEVFGERLLVPIAFAGRGDMSRGGLLLRSAQSNSELDYAPAESAARRGPRPARLEKVQ